MEKARKRKLMFCWPLVTAGLIALFWAIWYLAVGQVPTTTSIKMTDNWTSNLPFGISRWWDILIGPIWPICLIPLFTNEKIRKNKNLTFGLGLGLGLGLVLGLAFGLVFGLVLGLKWLFSFFKKNFGSSQELANSKAN